MNGFRRPDERDIINQKPSENKKIEKIRTLF